MNSNMSCVKSVRNQSCSGLHFLAFPHIQAEYGEIRCIFVYRPNAGKLGTRITPNKDTFYAVCVRLESLIFLVKKAVKFRNLQIIRILNTDKNRIFPIPFKVMYISLRYT